MSTGPSGSPSWSGWVSKLDVFMPSRVCGREPEMRFRFRTWRSGRWSAMVMSRNKVGIKYWIFRTVTGTEEREISNTTNAKSILNGSVRHNVRNELGVTVVGPKGR